MKRFAILLSTILAVLVSGEAAKAEWGGAHYGGHQPWWNIFAHRNKCLSPEEQRLQRFWHDYYDALRCYYDSLDNIDWVSYYKNHGYQINAQCCGPQGGCGSRVMFAPVFVSPQMQWAVPNSTLSGVPCGAPGVPPHVYSHMSGGYR